MNPVDVPYVLRFARRRRRRFGVGEHRASGRLDALDDAGRAAALASLRDALAAHEGPDGIVLDSGIWLVTARR